MRCARTLQCLLLAAITTGAGSCSDSSGPSGGTKPPADLNVVHVAANSTPLFNPSDSFYAVRGEDKELRIYFQDDVVVVELSLNGMHKGGLTLPAGTIAPTGKEIHAPCCDVFHLKDGKVVSFHCYVAVPILLEQLGVFGNLQAALKH